MKKVLKIKTVLLAMFTAVLALCCVTIAIITLRDTAVFAETAGGFEMKQGASVRVPSDETQNNGIRFTAKIDAETVDKLKEDGTPYVAGTFILPDFYYRENPVDETTLSEKYYWKTENGYSTDNTEGKREILNVLAAPYKEQAGDAFYTLNGSVLNIKDENLALEYIGVAYLKTEDAEGKESYTFAETTSDNARRPIDIVEMALDANEFTGATATALKEEYIDRYVETYQNANGGEYPAATYRENVYVSSENGFVLSESLSSKKTAAYQGYGTTVAADCAPLQDYVYDTLNENNERETTLKLSRTAEVNLYYTYVGDKFTVLDFDGEDPLNGGNYYEDKDEYAQINDGWASNGLKSMLITTGDAWAGATWTNGIKLPAPTSKFSFTSYLQGNADYSTQIWLSGIDASGKDVNEYYDITIKSGIHEMLITLQNEYTALTAFTWRVYTSSYRVDGLYAEYDEGTVLNAETDVPRYYDASSETISFDFAPKLLGSADSFETAVSYRIAGTDEWMPIASENGKYSFAVENRQNYEVKTVVSVNGEQTEKIYPVDYAQFILFSPETNAEDVFLGGTQTNPEVPAFEVIQTDGKNRIQLKLNVMDSWTGWDWSNLDGGLDLGGNANRLVMVVEAGSAMNGLPMYVRSASDSWILKNIDIPAGKSTLVLDFGCELNGMTGIQIRTWGFGNLYIDWIAAVQVSAE